MVDSQLVRGIIKDYGISQKSIAELLDVDQSSVSRRLGEPIVDSITFLEAVCSLAKISLPALLNGDVEVSTQRFSQFSNKKNEDCEYLKIALKAKDQLIDVLQKQIDDMKSSKGVN